MIYAYNDDDLVFSVRIEDKFEMEKIPLFTTFVECNGERVELFKLHSNDLFTLNQCDGVVTLSIIPKPIADEYEAGCRGRKHYFLERGLIIIEPNLDPEFDR